MHDVQQSLASHVFSVNRRRSERSEVTIPTHIMLPGRRLVPMEITNISEGGAFAALRVQIDERSKAKIDVPGFDWAPVTVVWAMNGRYGFAFDQPLSFHVTEALRVVYGRLV